MVSLQPSIALVGQVCIDHNTSEHATYTSWGSPVLYMGQYYRQHTNAHAIGISSYGPDLLPYLPDMTLQPATANRDKTLVYENDTSHGKRIQRCRHIDAASPPDLTAGVIAALREANIIIVATILSNYTADYVQKLLSYTTPGSLKVLCPQGYFRHVTPKGLVESCDFAEATQLLPLFDLVVYSEEDYPQALQAAQTWKQTIDTQFVVTQSKDGATIVGNRVLQHIPTTPIPLEEIVDSVGCGDTFAAVLALEYYKVNDLPAAVRAAHTAASAKLRAAVPIS